MVDFFTSKPVLAITSVLLLAAPLSHAYKTSLSAVHYGSSIGGAYASQLSSQSPSWDLVSQLAPTGNTYTNPNKYKTPLRLGVFYRHPHFTVDTYLRYFTNYKSDWTLSGANTGAGNSRYKGIGLGVDFEMPILSGPWIRTGLLLNAEYTKNRMVIFFNPASGANQSLDATSTNAVFGGGVFADVYLGDLWSMGIRGVYAYDLGGTWRARESSTFLGTAHTKGDRIVGSSATIAKSNFTHWRAEAILRLAFY